MGKYAVISGNMVSNVIVADNKEEAERALSCVLVEITPESFGGLGWIYENGKFFAPENQDEISY